MRGGLGRAGTLGARALFYCSMLTRTERSQVEESTTTMPRIAGFGESRTKGLVVEKERAGIPFEGSGFVWGSGTAMEHLHTPG